ncbi:MAG: Lon protease family protein [Alphaproteobacteria bacterium]
MATKPLDASVVGLPSFADRFAVDGRESYDVQVFDLGSHQRAREALRFALGIRHEGFNVFVLGEDRTGRMNATLGYLRAFAAKLPPVDDWVYLNNFHRPARPKPYRLPAGIGRKFRDRMAELVPQLATTLARSLNSQAYVDEVRAVNESARASLDERFAGVRARARDSGLDVLRTPQGLTIVVLGEDGQPLPPEALAALPDDRRAALEDAIAALDPMLDDLRLEARHAEGRIGTSIMEINQRIADAAIGPLLDALQTEFAGFKGLSRWLIELRTDILEHLTLFQRSGAEDETPDGTAAQRYAVNLLVDNGDSRNPPVVLEPNPTYENMFGAMMYRVENGTLETDFTQIRAGALHKANGGFLVLRAESLATEPLSWMYLKAALRDREIRIEELHRIGSAPMAGTPTPKAIPLRLLVVIVGAPHWYYQVFAADPSFITFFKVKADIDADMDATDADVATYARLIQRSAREQCNRRCDAGAIDRLLGQSARWSGERDKLSARFELIEDVLIEASRYVEETGGDTITVADVRRALEERRRRNARIEDRSQEGILKGDTLIDTSGHAVGQVNGLTYLELGDHAFGLPVRITARSHVGIHGVINIERFTELSGPIQQKGVYGLEGFLRGLFARGFPLSFTCSITFEQNYEGVEGDSASMAELCAIVSSLAEVPLRQDIALTGSVNQVGQVQAIGGVNQKIEGYFRACNERGLTGTQGCIIPVSNERTLTLREDVAAAVRDGRFHIWSFESVDDAIEHLSGLPAGRPDADGRFPPDGVYGRAYARLAAFDRALSDRAARRD